MHPRLQQAGTILADLLLPPVCMGCAERIDSHGGLCARCWSDLAFIDPPVCRVLGTPLPPGSQAGTLSAPAIAAPPPFAMLRAACRYDNTARRLVSAFKYADRTEMAQMLARQMVRAGGEVISASDVLVPVPLHWSRLIARRYNQAAELCRALSAQTGLAHEPGVVRRTRATRRQVGLKPSERALNVTGAFSVPEHLRERVLGRRVLLVDDVYTTGATVMAASRALRRAGVGEVNVLVFARVLEQI